MLATEARRDSQLCGTDEPKHFEQGPAQWPARPVLFHWKDWEAVSDKIVFVGSFFAWPFGAIVALRALAYLLRDSS